MTEYEQQIYDVIYDWWDIIFDINPPPVDRNGEYIDKNATIIDLVKSISEIDDAPWLNTTYDGFMTEYEAQMFHDFENRWEVRSKLLNRVKDDLFPEYTWEQLQPKTLEVINNIVESLVGK